MDALPILYRAIDDRCSELGASAALIARLDTARVRDELAEVPFFRRASAKKEHQHAPQGIAGPEVGPVLRAIATS